MALYASAGVPEYWIADPTRRAIVVYALESEAYVAIEPDADRCIASRALPGLRIDPKEVFASFD
jgi:Uma2 family endonuclease